VVYGPVAVEVLRLCGDADRAWPLAVEPAGAGPFDVELDWRRATCLRLDLAARRVEPACDARYRGPIVEGRL
jgi:hypothetical protein